MRIVFFGTSSFALPALRALSGSDHDIPMVVSRPPRPAGRGRKLRQPPVHDAAAALGIALEQPEKLNSKFIQLLDGLSPDVMVSAAYGGWLPERLLEVCELGVVNVHPSMLPLYRGAAPVTRAILAGDHETGVSFMKTDSGWDTGPVIARYPLEILAADTTGTLELRLAEKAGEKILPVLEGYSTGELEPTPRSGQGVYAEKVTTEETWLDWEQPAERLERKIRAFQPFPGARTSLNGNLLKVVEAEVSKAVLQPGCILVSGDILDVGCGGGTSLRILRLQPSSRSIMSASEYLRGARIGQGERFERAR